MGKANYLSQSKTRGEGCPEGRKEPSRVKAERFRGKRAVRKAKSETSKYVERRQGSQEALWLGNDNWASGWLKSR